MSTEVTTQTFPEGKDLKITFTEEGLNFSDVKEYLKRHPGNTIRDFLIDSLVLKLDLGDHKSKIESVIDLDGNNVIVIRVSKIEDPALKQILGGFAAKLTTDAMKIVEIIDAEASKSTAASHLATYKWWYLGGVTAVAATIVIMRKKD